MCLKNVLSINEILYVLWLGKKKNLNAYMKLLFNWFYVQWNIFLSHSLINQWIVYNAL